MGLYPPGSVIPCPVLVARLAVRTLRRLAKESAKSMPNLFQTHFIFPTACIQVVFFSPVPGCVVADCENLVFLPPTPDSRRTRNYCSYNIKFRVSLTVRATVFGPHCWICFCSNVLGPMAVGYVEGPLQTTTTTTTTITLHQGRSVTSCTPLTLATGLPRWRDF